MERIYINWRYWTHRVDIHGDNIYNLGYWTQGINIYGESIYKLGYWTHGVVDIYGDNIYNLGILDSRNRYIWRNYRSRNLGNSVNES